MRLRNRNDGPDVLCPDTTSLSRGFVTPSRVPVPAGVGAPAVR